jgi:uncharacterized membrane protein
MYNSQLDAKVLASGRLLSVDVLRGIAMVVMALDHARDYFSSVQFAPEDLSQTWGTLFFTRWITHFCAPVFFFLAGTGAYLFASRIKSTGEIARFLWTRGLWLVVLEYTVVGFSWAFHFPFGLAQTIWALGWSMVVLSLLVRLPVRWIAMTGVAMIALHNLTDWVMPAQFGGFAWLWTILHVPGFIQVIPGKFALIIGYPLIPWIGVMAAGYAFGAIMKLPPQRRQRIVLALGAGATLAFLILRGTNLYGNPPYTSQGSFIAAADANGPWHVQKTLTLTVISFFDVQKYPPSLQFLLMTLGPSLMLLAWLDRCTISQGIGRITGFFLVYGRVPLMFYVIHLYLIHAIAAFVTWLWHQPVWWLLHGAMFLNRRPQEYGHDLPFIYLMWITAVLALYVPCRWFAGVKARRKDWWLSYL